MMQCNTCFYQEKLYDGTLICKHIQSAHGLEADEEYKMCSEILECSLAECPLYEKAKFNCSDCTGNCYENQRLDKCKKDSEIRRVNYGEYYY